MADSEPARIDARPIRATSAETSWDRAVSRRDAIASVVRKTLADAGIEALVFVSAPGNYPPWLKLEAWLPIHSASGAVTGRERSELTVVVDVQPFRRQEVVVTSKLTRGQKKLTTEHRPKFTDSHAAEWARYAIGLGARPSNYRPIRDSMMSFLATILPFIPKPHKNPLLRHVRNFLVLSWTGYLTILSLSLIVAGSMGGRDWQYSSSALWAGVIGFAVVAIVMRRRGHAVVVADQPVIPPRDLSLVDSWHVVISGVGSDHAAIRERIAARFTGDTDAMNVSQYETYGYRTPNGYEERERLVVSKGQGLVHLHVYDFGNEVFVGWQSYLNWAKWEETTPVSSRVNGNQQTEYRGLRRGIYIPHQLDLIDLSSLSELVHRRLQLEIKAILREKAIDQEIDFRIIRGDRDFALDRSRHEKRESQAG